MTVLEDLCSLSSVDVDATTVWSTCHLYRSIHSTMLFQSLQSFPLHHFPSPKLKFLRKVVSFCHADKILLAICAFIIYHFLWLLSLKHDSMTHQCHLLHTFFVVPLTFSFRNKLLTKSVLMREGRAKREANLCLRIEFICPLAMETSRGFPLSIY